MELNFIYKISTKSDWLEIKKKGDYKGSKKDLEDGYIHFSGEDQVKGTLKKFYQNQKDLILLKVDAFKLEIYYGNKHLMEICFLIYILHSMCLM